jgi:hypothetical protein
MEESYSDKKESYLDQVKALQKKKEEKQKKMKEKEEWRKSLTQKESDDYNRWRQSRPLQAPILEAADDMKMALRAAEDRRLKKAEEAKKLKEAEEAKKLKEAEEKAEAAGEAIVKPSSKQETRSSSTSRERKKTKPESKSTAAPRSKSATRAPQISDFEYNYFNRQPDLDYRFNPQRKAIQKREAHERMLNLVSIAKKDAIKQEASASKISSNAVAQRISLATANSGTDALEQSRKLEDLVKQTFKKEKNAIETAFRGKALKETAARREQRMKDDAAIRLAENDTKYKVAAHERRFKSFRAIGSNIIPNDIITIARRIQEIVPNNINYINNLSSILTIAKALYYRDISPEQSEENIKNFLRYTYLAYEILEKILNETTEENMNKLNEVVEFLLKAAESVDSDMAKMLKPFIDIVPDEKNKIERKNEEDKLNRYVVLKRDKELQAQPLRIAVKIQAEEKEEKKRKQTEQTEQTEQMKKMVVSIMAKNAPTYKQVESTSKGPDTIRRVPEMTKEEASEMLAKNKAAKEAAAAKPTLSGRSSSTPKLRPLTRSMKGGRRKTKKTNKKKINKTNKKKNNKTNKKHKNKTRKKKQKIKY